MKKLKNNKIRKLLAFMVALALMVSCMPSAYTISASEAFGDGTDDIFTDGEFTSEPAAEESTPDVSSADQEESEQAQQTMLTYENDSVKVTAEAIDEGALPQNTTLRADGLSDSSSVSYDTAAQKLTAVAENKGSSLRGFFAYDVYFADANGSRVEPNGRIRVTFEYKTPAAPELTDAASTSVTVEKLHYNSSTGDTDVNTLQANEDLKVLNVNESKQIQTLQVETGNAAVFAVMWDSPETAEVNEEAVTEDTEAVSDNAEEVSIASEEFSDVSDISDEPEQDAVETPAAEEPEVTPDAEPTEEPAVEPTETPAAEPAEAPAEEEQAEDIESPDEVPAADENGETSLIEVVADETNLRVSPSTEAEVLATVNAGTQLPLLDTVTAEDGATWYKVSYEETEAYIRSDMAQIVGTDEEVPEDVQEETEDVSEEVTYTKTIDNVEITATAARGVLPEDAELVVTPIEKETDSDQYADVAERLEKKAENEEYSIAGFLAYDIYFQNSDGTKINPEDGKVKVSMDYKHAVAPEEVKDSDVPMALAADDNSQDSTTEQNLSVSVMHFVEDADGNVQSVVDMTQDDTANVETNAEGEVQKAEFETESFSTFAITWTYNKTLTVHLIDTAGKELAGTVEFKEAVQKDGANFRLAELGKKYTPEGYVYRQAKTGDQTIIYYISYNSIGGNGSGWYYTTADNENGNWTKVSGNSTTYSIYLVYEPVSAWIKDDIMNTGNLIPETNDSIKKQIESADTVTYAWYKSVDGGKTYTPVERTKHGDKYNLSEDGKLLNVALDGGALNSNQKSVQYKVKIGITKDGTTEEVETEVFNNEYWNELQNGSFETPTYTRTATGQFTNDYYKNAGGVWQSTGEGQNGSGDTVNIEIVNARTDSFKTSYSWYGNDVAADGNQFAELNCEAAGALYQDVMTYEGESMNYWLSHRARGRVKSKNSEFDTMYLVIMPTSVAMTAADDGSELKTQDQLESYLKSVLPSLNVNQAYSKTGDDILYNQNGILISRITSDDQSWHNVVKSVYKTTSYLTRFFFVSGNTESGNNTVGNFLDNVGFSQKLPPANPGTFNLQIKKNITGLTPGQIKTLENNLKFTIKKNGNVATGLKGGTLTLNNADQKDDDSGTYVWTFTDQGIDYNQNDIYSVEETGETLPGYTVNKNLTITGGTPLPDGQSTLIKEKDSALFTFTNDYVRETKNVSFTKIWDDYNNQYVSRPDSLTVTLNGKVNGKSYNKSYSAVLTERSATLTDDSKNNAEGVTVKFVNSTDARNWKCKWENVPLCDEDGNPITWSVEESPLEENGKTLVNGDYVYEMVKSGKGDGSDYTYKNILTSEESNTSDATTVDQNDQDESFYIANKLISKKITVKKIWNDADNANKTRPSKIEFKLQYRAKGSEEAWQYYQDKVYTIERDTWSREISGLSVTNDYQVEEINTGNYSPSYTVSQNGNELTITNTLNWKIVKKSSSADIYLGGAEFKLTDSKNNDVATGVSVSETGKITWTPIPANATLNDLNGTYTLTETKAPTGYSISGTTWTLNFVNGILTGLSDNSPDTNCSWDATTATLTITNVALYELPNSGGPGTYGFTISGVAILATALLLFINNKRREEEAKKS